MVRNSTNFEDKFRSLKYLHRTGYFQKCLAIWQETGAKWGIAQSILSLGIIDQADGNYKVARKKLEEALRIYGEIHDDISTAVGLIHIGFLDLDEGQTAAAFEHLKESLQIVAELGNTSFVLEAVVGIARYYCAQGDVEDGAELAGLAAAHAALAADVRIMRLEPLQIELARFLSPDELRAALERGEALDLETAVQRIQAEIGPNEVMI